METKIKENINKKILFFVLINVGYIGFLSSTLDGYAKAYYKPILIVWIFGIITWLVGSYYYFKDVIVVNENVEE